MTTPTRWMPLLLPALLLAAACSSDDAPATSSPAPTEATADASAAAFETADVVIDGATLSKLDDPATDPTIGTAAPVITGMNFDSDEITIGGPSDGPTLLVFLAHWCPHCNDEIPELNELRDTDALPEGLDVVGISTAAAADRDNYPPSAWIVEKDWTWPVLVDALGADAWQAYGGAGFPFAVMLDADGNVLARKAGSSSAAQIDAWIDSALDATN